MQEAHPNSPDDLRSRSRLGEVAAVFSRLGFTAFGGPAAHISLMEEEFVHRRKWVDRRHFLDLCSAINFIPGPNSTELAIHLGLIRAGFPGLVVAGVCFIVPAVLIILPIAWVYVHYGKLPQVQPALEGIAAAIAAVVAAATWRLLKPMRRDFFGLWVVALSVLLYFGLRIIHAPQPDLLIIVLAGIVGAMKRWMENNQTLVSLVPLPLANEVVVSFDVLNVGPWVKLFAIFFKIGLTLFGSGYVLVTYLQTSMVDERGWLTQQQLLDAVAVGQFTPGPLLTTATFIGYVLGATRFGDGFADGLLGAILATTAIFLPAFVLIAVLSGVLDRLRKSPRARAIFDAMNAAVVGLLVATCAQLFVGTCLTGDFSDFRWSSLAIFVGSLVFLLRGVNSTWVILLAGALGAGEWFASH